jgi:imidazoleglycerol phosphate synthase glutamine amidotransferase subunit HisH
MNQTLDVVIGPCSMVETDAMQHALAKVGARTRSCAGPQDMRHAQAVVVPWSACSWRGAQRYAELGLAEALVERIKAGRPTLVVGTAMQMIGLGCAEEGRRGLAALDLHSELGDRAPEACAWQQVWSATESSPVPNGRYAFQRRYRATRPPPGWACTVSDAEGLQLASLERGAVLVTQFRPELSGAAGLEVLLRWCNRSRPVLRLQEELAPASPLNAA